ncbi:Transcription factor [Arachis hypogaea]|nr:Transcription factor [Arachis hypogaea]
MDRASVKAKDDAAESCNIKSFSNPDGCIRTWLQRKSKDSEVDVRIVDDDVTIKLFQRKKINCLLSVAKFLDELQLELHHVAGGHVGKYYSFLFNSKIIEGSSVYASAIANSVIDVMDTQYFLAEIEGPEQKSDSEAEKGLQMLLDYDLPALKVDFLELQKPNWRAFNCVGKIWERMTVTSFKLASVRRSDRRKRINGSYSDMIENRQMISRAVTAHLEHFH